MSIQASRALATFFRQETGDALRLVAHYSDDSLELVYLRDDLERRYDDDDFRETFRNHRKDRRVAASQSEILDAGTQHCTLRVYDEAIVFNFSQTDDIGTIVSLNPDVGQNLLSFITRSLNELHKESPQQVTAPKWVSN